MPEPINTHDARRASALVPPAIIDAHCHIFNATDLPALSFIRLVVRERYGESGDFADLVIGFLAEILTGNAPRAGDELADIEGRRRPPLDVGPLFDDMGNALPPVEAPLPDPAVRNGTDDETPSDALGSGAERGRTASEKSELRRLLQWIRLFKKSRRGLSRVLAAIYQRSGHQCVLMAPALVDYNAWLQHPERRHQQLTDQVQVMGAISRQPGTARIHGFLGFDPIRAILAKRDRLPAGVVTLDAFDPHKLLDDAVKKHGFLGAKLYPPMGFRPWKNDADDTTFPEAVKADVNSDGISDRELGHAIDAELAHLYTYCAAEGIPILAHCANSNQTDTCFGWRASPQYWDAVVEKFSTKDRPLRVCLAHLDGFNAHTHHTSCLPPGTLAEAWEHLFGKITSRAGGEYVFADLSYFQELLDRNPGWEERRAVLLEQFKELLRIHRIVDHLCYGSDWLMLGIEKRHEHHHEEVARFLSEAGVLREDIARIFFQNSLKMLGLRQGDQNRARLQQFYERNNILHFFPRLDAQV